MSDAYANRYDAVVVGAGHNGLVAAAYLALGGLRVAVFERRGVLGGVAATEPVFPGWQVDTGLSDAGRFLPQIVEDLRLENHGLAFIEPPALVYTPLPGGRSLTLWRDLERTQEEIGQFSAVDAARFREYAAHVRRMASVLAPVLAMTPPALPAARPAELAPWAWLGLQARRQGGEAIMELLRALPMPAADFLDEWFETPALKAALGAPGVEGLFQGPLASGTAFLLLYAALHAGEAGFRSTRFVRGGIGALSAALAEAARLRGVEVCPGQGVRSIMMEDGRASGVLLEDGQFVPAGLVLSGADPRHTFFDLVGAEHLEVGFVREVKNIRFRGSTARVNLALSGLPAFPPPATRRPDDDHLLPGAHLSGHIQVCPDLRCLERAFDDAKYGRVSRQPYLSARLPTVTDPSLAPPGRHLLCVDVRYAPYHLREGRWEEEEAERLYERVVATLEAYAPGLRGLILDRQMITPLDYEREYGLAEGSRTHGQMGLDSLLFMRPVSGWGQYRTPVEGLYLCGAGAHPGGGLTGAPGYNAAREALKQRG